MTSPMPKFNFFDAEAPIYTRTRYLPSSKVHDCDVRDSLISEGCIINGARLQRSIIGLRSRIGQGAVVDASIIMGADYYQSIEEMSSDIEASVPRIGIGQESIIRRAIIDKNARIGAHVQLVNEYGIENMDSEDKSYYIRDRIILVPKNSTIPDGTVV